MSRKQKTRLCVQPFARRGCTSGRVPEIPRDQGARTLRTSSRLTVAILESEEQQLNTIQGDLPFEVVLDSGAADHVADNVDAPGYSVEPSAGSKAGAAFIAANGAKIPNRGQMTLSLKADGGQPIMSTFQVCQTNRPLWSVGKICDAGCKVIFSSDGAEVVSKTSGKSLCTFERRGGLYVGTLGLANPRSASAFAGQGK